MKGLFVEVASTPPGYLRQLVTHINGHDPGLSELVLTDVQAWHWPEIDGAGIRRVYAGIERVYVGATQVPWYGPRSDTPKDLQPWMVPVAGVGGMLTPSYRWDQIRLDMETFRQAALRGHSLYIRQEVGIDALGDHPRLRQAWEAYLIELCRQLYTLSPSVKVLWSPYAWDLWDSVSTSRRARIAAAMEVLVANVRTYSKTPGLTFIDLQDGRGAQPSEPESDAVNWWNLIKDCGAQVRVNAEWFTPDLQPQDKTVMAQRLSRYEAEGIPVGCSWEARFWLPPLYPNH